MLTFPLKGILGIFEDLTRLKAIGIQTDQLLAAILSVWPWQIDLIGESPKKLQTPL